jgi:pre-mRNA-splicing factor ATP-dependent RNA helicase DHX38/PRP16
VLGFFAKMSENIHRLEGTGPQVGGLVIRKKKTEDDEDSPRVAKLPHLENKSLLGLDKLAELKEKERAMAKKVKDLEDEKIFNKKPRGSSENDDVDKDKKSRHYRKSHEETPSHTGGVSKDAKQRRHDRRAKERDRDAQRGFYVSTKDKRRESRLRREDRHRRHSQSVDSSERKRRERDWENETPRSKRGGDDDDDIVTPYLKVKDTPSHANWDEDDHRTPGKFSTWDMPTPYTGRREDDSYRSNRSSSRSSSRSGRRYEKETPLPTPSYKKNPWHKRGGSSTSSRQDKTGGDKTPAAVDHSDWEEEQTRLDREWYGLDEGYDDAHNPFAGISAEYTKKKEEQMEQKKHRKLTAKQAQRHKDNELWEKNRMFRSGAVTRLDHDEDFDEISEAKVHLLVNNIIPPFLDGRIVFTKQQEPVVPIKDPTSDMAMVSKKGSKLVKVHREQAERKKAQRKFELAGTKMGNILGVEKVDDREDKATDDTMDHRDSHKFADHMKVDQEKKSEFSMNKTLKEQREYLPIYACRHELLKIVRDNSVVIIVGETGSGKGLKIYQITNNF